MLDVLIVGSGPAGLSAAIYAKRANLKVCVAEKEYLGTGQIAESHQVDNYPGFNGVSGYELGELFRGHAVNMGVDFYQGEATDFEHLPDGWRVWFDNGDMIMAKCIIYCAGAVHRRLLVPGEKEFSGRGVSYCAVCDGAFYKGKKAAVIGGGDTALDDALYLAEICEKIYLVHRRKEFRGSMQTLEKIRQRENIEIITGAQVVEILGERKADALLLDQGQKLPVEGVFVAIGMVPQTESLKGIVALDESGYVEADETGKTSAEDFFAAGDVRRKQLRQVVTAVSDGANAAASAAKNIRNFSIDK